jgi:hypothetical protein
VTTALYLLSLLMYSFFSFINIPKVWLMIFIQAVLITGIYFCL